MAKVKKQAKFTKAENKILKERSSQIYDNLYYKFISERSAAFENQNGNADWNAFNSGWSKALWAISKTIAVQEVMECRKQKELTQPASPTTSDVPSSSSTSTSLDIKLPETPLTSPSVISSEAP